MPSFGSETGNALYLIVCAAPPARDTPQLVQQLRADGWDVCVIATPSALDWIDAHELAELTGHAVRSKFRQPDHEEFIPKGDAVMVAPLTFNTLNKWAAGINDNLALGLLNEALGRGVRTSAQPWISSALRAHPVYASSESLLVAAGVEIFGTEDAGILSPETKIEKVKDLGSFATPALDPQYRRLS